MFGILPAQNAPKGTLRQACPHFVFPSPSSALRSAQESHSEESQSRIVFQGHKTHHKPLYSISIGILRCAQEDKYE